MLDIVSFKKYNGNIIKMILVFCSFCKGVGSVVNRFDYVIHQAKDQRKENNEKLFNERFESLAKKTGREPEEIKNEFNKYMQKTDGRGSVRDFEKTMLARKALAQLKTPYAKKEYDTVEI